MLAFRSDFLHTELSKTVWDPMKLVTNLHYAIISGSWPFDKKL